MDQAQQSITCDPSQVRLPEVSFGIEQSRTRLRSWLLAIFAVSVLVTVLRRPDAVLNPQFFAEDGKIFAAEAYNQGPLVSLFMPYNGYFVTFPRLVAEFAYLFPLLYTPLIFNLAGMFCQILPVMLLVSSRMNGVGPLPFRYLLSGVYLALPNCWEVNVNITSSQWHLAIAVVLLLTAEVPKSALAKGVDLAAYVLCGLTGPFSILIVPLSGWIAFRARRRWHWIVCGVFLASAVITFSTVLLSFPNRNQGRPLGQGVDALARILGGQVYLGTLLGMSSLPQLMSSRSLTLIAIGGTLLVFVTCVAFSGPEYRVFAVFSAMVFVVAVLNPATDRNESGSSWAILVRAAGVHYWLLPALAFAWALVWLTFGPKRNQVTQIIGSIVLFIMLTGFIRDFRHAPYQDLHFKDYANRFESMGAGQSIIIPENPSGWTMRLVRK